MEKLGLYDKNGTYIDEFVLRGEKHTLKDGKFYKVIILFIINSNDKFLIQKSSNIKGNIFETLGGHVLNGEKTSEAVIREAYEELHLNIMPQELHFFKRYFYKKSIQDVYYIKKTIDIKKMVLQFNEVISIELCRKEKIIKLIEKNQFRKKDIIPFMDLIEFLNV